MPKPKFRVSPAILNLLKWKLEDALMFRINSKPDCKKAALVISDKIGKAISESTIYRLFLWENNENSPFLQTLENLAVFIGYSNWNLLETDLIDLGKFRVKSGIFADDYDKEPLSLLLVCIETGNFHVLRKFLSQFPDNLSFEKKIILGEELYAALYRNPEATVAFYKAFHRIPIVRESFFEFFADPQFKLNKYEEGLKCYLENINPLSSIQCLQDYLFANSLLLRHYFFTKRIQELTALGHELYDSIHITQEQLEQIHIYPHIRYRTYFLLYQFAKNGFDESYWEWLMEYAVRLAQRNLRWEQKIVVHTVLDALQFDEGYLNRSYAIFNAEFKELFDLIPPHLLSRPIKDRLRFFDTNAAQIFD